MTALHDQLSSYTQAFYRQIPGIRDGSATAVHDARVAIRRIRAVLPVARVLHPALEVDDVDRAVRGLARALGRARDIDVAIELCASIERAAPYLVTAVAALMRGLRIDQARAQRRLVKAVDAANFEALDELIRSMPRPTRLGTLAHGRPHDHALRVMASEQAETVRTAIGHASGVYFPRRAHGARIEIKKLRYIVELMTATSDRACLIKPLKRAQEALGALHDRDLLRTRVRRVRDDAPVPRREFEALTAHLDAECSGLFARYLRDRPALLDICGALQTRGRGWRGVPVTVGAVAGVAVIALPAAVGWLRRSPRGVRPPDARLQLSAPVEVKAR